VKQVIYVVYFNEDEDEFEVKCTCDSFESRGILCRHVISVLSAHNITSLPPKYYLDRWRKDVKRRYTLVKSSYDSLSENPNVERYDNLCEGMHKLAEIAARNIDHYTKVQRHIDMLTKELCGLSCEPSPPSRTLPGASSTFNASIDGDDLAVESDQVHSPLVVRHKGRLPYKRKVSAVEQAAVKKSQGKSNELPIKGKDFAYYPSPSA
jgi:hypothetical protein